MDKLESYIYLIKDTFISSLIFLPYNELVFDAMRIFETYDLKLMIILAVIGGTLGAASNFAIGYLVKILNEKNLIFQGRALLQKWQGKFDQYGIYVVLFSAIPLWGALISFSAGIFKMDPKKFFALAFVSKAFLYIIKAFI